MRRSSIRTRPTDGRLAQSVWEALRRARRPIGAQTLADRAETSVWTVRHLLRRWQAEGLAECTTPAERGPTGQLSAARWRVAHDIGRIAPILRGAWWSGAGYTDPNQAEARP